MKKLFAICWIWTISLIEMYAYTLSLEKELYVPIVMDDITMMMPLRP